jgi:TolC family type I secretion outer membrane protein
VSISLATRPNMSFARASVSVLVLASLLGAWGSMIALPAEAQAPEARSSTDTFTVRQAVRHALRANPVIQAAEQGATAAAASVREARSAWFPEVTGQASYRRLSGNVDYTVELPGETGEQPVTFAPAILNRYSTRASVTQPLFTGFRIPNQHDAAQARTEAARAQVASTEQSVAFETRAAYWDLYRAQAQARATAKSVELIERRLTDIRNQRAAGRATEADVLRVKARRDRVRAERLRARNAVQSARRALNDQMGRPLEAPVTLADTVQLSQTERPADALVERALQQRPNLRALRQTVRAQAAEVDVAQSDWFPQVALTGSYLYARPNEQLFPPEDRFQGTWEAGVQLSWDLSLGFRTDAAADRARAQWQQARYELQDRRQSVRAEVKQRAEDVAQAREAVAAAETSLESARAAYRAVQSRFEEGMVVVSDLLDAERALREARSQLAAAQAEYALARAALARAVGRSVDQNTTSAQ